jgi:hypothetical protein
MVLSSVNPIIKKLATGWERSFQDYMPKFFQSYIEGCSKLLDEAHEAIKHRTKPNNAGFMSLVALDTQISTYKSLVADLSLELIGKTNELQREANRIFSSTIADSMYDVYDKCAKESGKGCYVRMKRNMTEYIDTHRCTMFPRATIAVKAQLREMCITLEAFMAEKTKEIYTNMRDDYVRALGSIQANTSEEMMNLRRDVLGLLRSVHARFEPIAKGEFTRTPGIGDANNSDDELDTEFVKLEPDDLDNDMGSREWANAYSDDEQGDDDCSDDDYPSDDSSDDDYCDELP